VLLCDGVHGGLTERRGRSARKALMRVGQARLSGYERSGEQKSRVCARERAAEKAVSISPPGSRPPGLQEAHGGALDKIAALCLAGRYLQIPRVVSAFHQNRRALQHQPSCPPIMPLRLLYPRLKPTHPAATPPRLCTTRRVRECLQSTVLAR
jgi:hypothetical protein